MNDSSALPILNSTLSLSSSLNDISNVLLIPSFAIGLIPLKLFTIAVLVIIIKQKKKNNNKIGQFYYLLTNETCDMMHAIIFCFGAALRCGSYCSFGYNYVAKIIDLACYVYGIPVLLQMQILIEIAFTLHRIKALKFTNTQVRNGMKFRYKLAISLVVSSILAVPNYLMTRDIMPVGVLVPSNQTLYAIDTRPIFKTYFWSIGLSVFNIIRSIIPVLVLFISNIVLIHKLKKYEINQRSNAVPPPLPENQNNTAEIHKSLKEVNISRLVFGINANYMIGHFPYFLLPFFFLYSETDSTIFIYFNTAIRLLLIICHYNYILIFYK
jgi:hypothetical protein